MSNELTIEEALGIVKADHKKSHTNRLFPKMCRWCRIEQIGVDAKTDKRRLAYKMVQDWDTKDD